MITVVPAQEPAIFDARVRQPGQAFLDEQPVGAKIDFKNREYWRRILDELHESYRGICSYTCHYIPFDTGADTVEHFVARDVDPDLAYEWDNFRLVCNRLNGRKSNYSDVVDPFRVVQGMFELDFPSLQVSVGTGVRGAIANLAVSTIARLGLNSERTVRARQKYVLEFRDGEISRGYLARHAPFIHSELSRQNITKADLTGIMVNPW